MANAYLASLNLQEIRIPDGILTQRATAYPGATTVSGDINGLLSQAIKEAMTSGSGFGEKVH